jgi:DNA-binding transcriptional ArsR family regulator
LLTSFAFLLVILVKLFIFINAYKVVSNSKKEKISLRDLVYTISILLIFMMSLSVKSQDLTVFEGNWEASIQEKTQREFIDTLEFVDELISLEDNDLYEAAYLDADKSGNLIVYDYSKERIIFFPTGDYKSFNEITDGIGRGPKELKLARDLKFDSEGFIWVIDLDGGKIQKWDSENNLIKNFKPSLKYVRQYRIAVC